MEGAIFTLQYSVKMYSLPLEHGVMFSHEQFSTDGSQTSSIVRKTPHGTNITSCSVFFLWLIHEVPRLHKAVSRQTLTNMKLHTVCPQRMCGVCDPGDCVTMGRQNKIVAGGEALDQKQGSWS